MERLKEELNRLPTLKQQVANSSFSDDDKADLQESLTNLEEEIGLVIDQSKPTDEQTNYLQQRIQAFNIRFAVLLK